MFANLRISGFARKHLFRVTVSAKDLVRAHPFKASPGIFLREQPGRIDGDRVDQSAVVLGPAPARAGAVVTTNSAAS
jgi:hypothetical protein